MKVEWCFGPGDVESVLVLAERMKENGLVRGRILRNVTKEQAVDLTRASAWHRLVYSLLTTQQRSGPQAPVTRFIRKQPFPLNLDACEDGPEGFIAETLREHGGVRWPDQVGRYAEENLRRLGDGLWVEFLEVLHSLKTDATWIDERRAARAVASWFIGFGPKQSRNFLQMIGLTRYEIPLDSRVTRWLREHGFPIPLSASVLNDAEYYEFVSDGVRELCAKVDILPCVFDAMVFSSYDEEDWGAQDAF